MRRALPVRSGHALVDAAARARLQPHESWVGTPIPFRLAQATGKWRRRPREQPDLERHSHGNANVPGRLPEPTASPSELKISA
jgi:hypothetical protein